MTVPVLNRKLVLEHPATIADGAGGYQVTWTTLGTLWAEIRSGTGREREVHNVPRSQVPLIVTVRAAPVGSSNRPRAGQRFVEGGRIYNINAVTELSGKRQYLQCRVLEEVAT